MSQNDDDALRRLLTDIPKLHWLLLFVSVILILPLLVLLNVKPPLNMIILFLYTGSAMMGIILRHRAKVEKETIEKMMRGD